MISLKLPDGSFFPLITHHGETKKFTLTPAAPGAHRVIIPFFTQVEDQEPQLSGILRLEGSGEELTLTISLDQDGEFTALVVDRGNGTTSNFNSRVLTSTDQPLDEDFDQEHGWQEQIALVDNYFEEPSSQDRGLEGFETQALSRDETIDFDDSSNLFQDSDFDIDSDFDAEENYFDHDPSDRQRLEGSDPEEIEPEEDEFNVFADDEVDLDSEFELDSPTGSIPEVIGYQKPNPWLVAGIGTLVLALGYLGAYGVFASIRSEAFPLLEQLFL